MVFWRAAEEEAAKELPQMPLESNQDFDRVDEDEAESLVGGLKEGVE